LSFEKWFVEILYEEARGYHYREKGSIRVEFNDLAQGVTYN